MGLPPPKFNLSKAEAQAIRESKGNKYRLVLTANKGVTMVGMDRQYYINKSNNLLAQPSYRTIPREMEHPRKALTHCEYPKWL